MDSPSSLLDQPPAVCPRCGQAGRSVGGLCGGCLASTAFLVEEIFEDAAAVVPQTLGGHTLFEELGRGGMGVVYRARQVALQRDVALKVVAAGPLADPEFLARFRSEARLAGKLHHPHIVAVHEVGETTEHAFFSMDLVPGGTLSRRIREHGPMAPAAAVCFMVKLASALDHAHAAGILHRDIKPSNILLDFEGEPMLADFGLAKSSQDVGLTMSNQAMGTPSWQAPEQISGMGAVDERSDVYGLGAVLYYCLAGQPPFRAQNVSDLLLQVKTEIPVSPRLLQPVVSKDLETITLKCLEKSPSRRFASARALAEELRRVEQGRPILARPVGLAYRAWRWACWHKMIALLLGLLVVIIMGSTVGLTLLWWQARDAAEAEGRQRRTAEEDLWHSKIQSARGQRLTGDSDTRSKVLALVKQAAEWRVSAEVRSEAVAALALPELHNHQLCVDFSATSRAGRSIILHPSQALGCLNDHAGGLEIVSLVTGEVIRHFQTAGPSTTRFHGFSIGGKYACRAHEQGLDLFSMQDASMDAASVLPEALRQEICYDLSFSGDDGVLATLGPVGLKLWKMPEARLLDSQQVDMVGVHMALSPLGNQLAVFQSPDQDKQVLEFYDITEKSGSTRQILRKSVVMPESVCALAWSTDQHWLACGLDSGEIKLVDAETGELAGAFVGHTLRAHQLRFCQSDRLLLSTSWDNSLRLWDVYSGKQVLNQEGAGHFGMAENEHLLFAQKSYSEVQKFEMLYSEVVQSFSPPARSKLAPAECVASTPDGNFLVAAAGHSTRVWNRQTGAVHDVPGKSLSVLMPAEGNSLLVAGGLGVLHYPFSRRDGTLGIPELVGKPNYTNYAVLSGDGLTLAVSCSPLSQPGGNRSTVEIWRKGEFVRSVESGNYFPPLALDEAGTVLAAGGHQTAKIRCWDLRSGERIKLEGSDAELKDDGPRVAVSPTGHRLASVSARQARLWDLKTGGVVKTLRGESASRFVLAAFSPSGALLAVSGKRAELWLLNADSGEMISVLEVPNAVQPTALNFRADGQELVVGLANGGVLVWDFARLRTELRGLHLDW